MPDMSTDEMNQLAQKLAKMSYRRAKGYVRGLDRRSQLEIFRVAVGTNQWLTRWALPTKKILVTLVEEKEVKGATTDMGWVPTRFRYVEARVEELPASHVPILQGNNPRPAAPGAAR